MRLMSPNLCVELKVLAACICLWHVIGPDTSKFSNCYTMEVCMCIIIMQLACVHAYVSIIMCVMYYTVGSM